MWNSFYFLPKKTTKKNKKTTTTTTKKTNKNKITPFSHNLNNMTQTGHFKL
jgi:hypothetical protein